MSQDKVLEATLKLIEKKFGQGALMRLGDRKVLDVEVIPTGALSLDLALGVGGIPRGRVIEIFGPEASGKTTLALHIIAEAQAQGLKVAFIDAEHALDPLYAQRIGVELPNLYISQPDYGEQALEIVDTLVRSGVFGVIVLDSVAALVPKAEVEGNMGDVHMGLQARLMSQALRKITPLTSKTNSTVIFLNQIRMDLGVKFGNPETTPGGRALKFFASVRLDVRRRAAITEGGEVKGHWREVKVVKNKVAPPFRSASFPIYFGTGIDKAASMLDAAIKVGLVEQKGSYFIYKPKDIKAQGKTAFIELIRKDKSLQKSIEKHVREYLKTKRI